NTASTRVNSALLPRFTGKNVRLACRPIKAQDDQFMGDNATVAASDEGEVTVTLRSDTHMAPDTFYEVLGIVVNPTTIKTYRCTSMGTNIDMKLVDDSIRLMHDPRFYTQIFDTD
ncbi:replication factor A protein 3, partial [Mycena pura]